MAPESPTVSVRVFRPIAAALRERGIDPTPVFGELGLDCAQMADPDLRVGVELVNRVWMQAVETTGDPGFGLASGELIRPGMYDVMDYAMRASGTLGEAFDLYARSVRLLHSAAGVHVIERGSTIDLVHHIESGEELVPAWMQYAFSALVTFGRQTTGEHWSPVSVEFAHAPAPDGPIARALECAVRWQGSAHVLSMRREDWDRPLRGADPALAEALQRHLFELLMKLPSGGALADQVRRLIGSELRKGEVTAACVGRKLGLSPRTLGRRLAAERTGFQTLLDEVRRQMAVRFLRDSDLPIDRVGVMLGFADGRVFRRAFKRWTGMTPSAFRKDIDPRECSDG